MPFDVIKKKCGRPKKYAAFTKVKLKANTKESSFKIKINQNGFLDTMKMLTGCTQKHCALRTHSIDLFPCGTIKLKAFEDLKTKIEEEYFHIQNTRSMRNCKIA